MALFTCASTRAVHLKLCKDLTAREFQRSLKEFVARRGSPTAIVSDNAKTFQATKKWLKTLKKDEDLFNFLATKEIEWRFNMSRAPWWGGFFEHLIGMMKNTLSKAVGRALLTFEELEEVLLDVETFLNNRPLCYMEEEIEQPVITPSILLRGQPMQFLEQNPDDVTDERVEITRRLRYLKTCRENLKKRWLNEYLVALQERFKRGPVIKDSTKNRANWRVGRVVDSIVGKDGVTRGYKIRTGNGYIIERPLQLLCDLEIGGASNDIEMVGDLVEGSRDQHQPVTTRPRRVASRTAENRLVGVIANENEED